MILCISEGRFGNQLFQIAALLTARKDNEIAVAVGFHDLPNLSSFSRLIQFKGLRSSGKRFSQPVSFVRLGRLLRLLASVRILSEVTIDRRKRIFARKKGMIPWIAVFTNRFLQVGDLAHDEHIAKLHETVSTQIDSSHFIGTRSFVFVHVRRGDYLSFPSETESVALPNSYYRRGLEILKSRYPEARTIIFSDDPDWVSSQNVFADFEICTWPALESWILMSTAVGGVLSASSYSYWAAKVATFRGRESHPNLFVAPKFWLGWRKEKWLPRDIESKSFEYLDVTETQP